MGLVVFIPTETDTMTDVNGFQTYGVFISAETETETDKMSCIELRGWVHTAQQQETKANFHCFLYTL